MATWTVLRSGDWFNQSPLLSTVLLDYAAHPSWVGCIVQKYAMLTEVFIVKMVVGGISKCVGGWTASIRTFGAARWLNNCCPGN